MHKRALGERLRGLRTARKLSLAQLEQGTEISSSFLSLVEQGRSDISVSRLLRLARYYDIDITDLIADDLLADVDDMLVVRDGHGSVLSSRGIELSVLAPAGWTMHPTIACYEPGTTVVIEQPADETFVYVLEGAFEVVFAASEPLTLDRGDSLVHRRARAHTVTNVGAERGVLLTTHLKT